MKIFVSALVASLLTFAYLEYDYSPSKAVTLPSEIIKIPQQIIASSFLEDTESSLKQKQKAIALLIRFDSDYFIEIDNAIGQQFTKAATHKIAKRKYDLIKNFIAAYDRLKEHPDLLNAQLKYHRVNSLEELKQKMFVNEMYKNTLVLQALRQRFPKHTDKEIVSEILK